MKNAYLFIYLTIIFLALNSCISTSNDEDNLYFNDSLNSVVNTLPIFLRINSTAFETINSNRLNNISTGDLFKINSAKRTNNKIEVSVSYSGGCKQHNFEIIWDGVVYTNNPCQVNLLIIHNANNDNCEALITETVSINLKELIGDNNYKDSCTYNIFTSFNANKKADAIVESSN